MESPKYILTVFNTMTQRNEEIEVDEEGLSHFSQDRLEHKRQ